MSQTKQVQNNTRILIASGLAVVAALALIVLYGWYQDILILKTLLPGRPDMKANTAFCFLLISLAMSFAALPSRPNWARMASLLFSGATLVFAGLVLSQYIWSIDVGIDQILFIDTNTKGHSPPGRFAPITAFNFILLAIAVLLDRGPRIPWYRTSQSFFMLSFLISFQSFLGGALGIPEIFGMGLFIPMAVQTSFSFAVLSVCFLALRAHEGFMESFSAHTPSAVMARRMMISVVLVPPLIRGLSSLGTKTGVYNEGFSTFLQVMGSMTFISIIVTATAVALLKTEREREKLRASERAAFQEAVAASQAKSQFLANMSHEIRTPLGVILGFSDLGLESVQNPNEVRTYLNGIRRNAESLSKLLGEILDLSKVEARKLEIEKIRFSLGSVIEEIFSMLSLKAQERSISLNLLYEGSVPTMIETDPTRLKQILTNLIGNAIKFTKQGSVDVIVSAEKVSHGQPLILRFTVQDTGIGISPEQRERLFKPFSQADSSMTRRFGGSGLGLMLSKELALALGGDLTLVDSSPGKGSVFSVSISAGKVQEDSFDEVEVESPDVTSDSELKPTCLIGLRILLVEDAIENQILVSHYLRPTGALVEMAANGEEGVKKALQNEYDVVLMDIQMPVMDGFQATHFLREQGYKKPIIALTAHALQEEKEKALHSGFNDYLTKPISKETLIEGLKNAQSNSQSNFDATAYTPSTTSAIF